MAGTATSSYPASFTIDPPDRIANWRPIGHLILAIPHYVVLYLLQIVGRVCAVISWLAILFTGKQPEGLANVQCMYQRYQMRLWAYVAFMVEDYPPFSFSMAATDPGDVPRVKVDFDVALEGRNRLTVFFRLLLVIPQVVALAVAWIAGFVCVVIAFFAVLFTGTWPAGLRKFVYGLMRWNIRVNAYLNLLTDEYPPFSLD
jgi:hypothetical protein